MTLIANQRSQEPVFYFNKKGVLVAIKLKKLLCKKLKQKLYINWCQYAEKNS